MNGMSRFYWAPGPSSDGLEGRRVGRRLAAMAVAVVVAAGVVGLVAPSSDDGLRIGPGGAMAKADQTKEAEPRSAPPSKLMELINTRMKKAQEQERRAKEAQRQMELLKSDLTQRIEALRKERQELSKLAKTQTQRKEADLVLLAKSLAETPPEQAGVILGELEADLAAAILKRMNKRKAGRIWGYIKAERAAAISRALADRASETKAKRPPTRRRRPKLLPPPLPLE